ncbi:MAG: Rieske 2Fe-2S domain-containing protein [Beijerinckiaceae bacterium]|nr:Rieske 2Fe-2S domain-containing protein [Beijerinckiaceae bacterium]
MINVAQVSDEGGSLNPRDVSKGSPALALLRSYWQPIYASEKLVKGRPAAINVLGEQMTLYRGDGGEAYLIGPYCAHRGAKLSTGRVEGEHLHCFYHGWTYDGAGQCVAQPAEPPGGAARTKIEGWPVREYLGLIFAYLGGGDPPPMPYFDAYHRDGFTQVRESRRPWSYFDQLENSVDEVHFNFVHRKSKFTDVGLNDEIPELTCEETDYGILRMGRRGNRIRKSHILMPNCMYSMVFEHFKGWAEHLSWRVPIDRHSHISFMIECIHKEGEEAEAFRKLRAEQREELKNLEPADKVIARILSGDLHIDDIEWRPDIVVIQDGAAMAGLDPNRDPDKDQLRSSDRQVALLRRIWRRELEAITEGRQTREWRIPRELKPTTGTPLDS